MDDLISRQKAIEILGEHCKMDYNKICGKDCECVEYRELRDLPSAQQRIPPRRCIDCESFNKSQLLVPQSEQKRWIPCSERLPENDFTDVLICVHDKRKGCENDFYVIQAYTAEKHWFPTLHVDMMDFYVVAWMPLPEPYKGDANG